MSKNDCKVFLGNLSSSCRKRDIEQFFKDYGYLVDIVIKQNYGFVQFEDSRYARDAIYHRNGKYLKGRKVKVEAVLGSIYKAIVENLSIKVSWQDLKDLMRQAGDVTYVDAHKKRRNEGLVEFASRRDLEKAIEMFNNYVIHGRRIRIYKKRKRSLSQPKSSRTLKSGSKGPHGARSMELYPSRSRRSFASRSRSSRASRSRSSMTFRSRSLIASRSRSSSTYRSRSSLASRSRSSLASKSKSSPASRSRSSLYSRSSSLPLRSRILHSSRSRESSRTKSSSLSVKKNNSMTVSRSRSSNRSKSHSRGDSGTSNSSKFGYDRSSSFRSTSESSSDSKNSSSRFKRSRK